MNPTTLAFHSGGSSIESWGPLVVTGVGYALIVVALLVFGRGERGSPLWVAVRRISTALERATGIPGWAAASAGTALWGLLVAGIGFYNDVSWHIARGRDEDLFTAPHMMIVVGLAAIAGASLIGIVFASVDRAEVGLRRGVVRVPWSSVVLGVLGFGALTGFPLDELWHARYGIDVTMWSPTHLIMIVGASLAPVGAWLALGEAGIRARRWWPGIVHLVVGMLTLAGLSSVQGEFAFGVPQFQQLYHPVLVLLAGALALTAARVVIGRGGALAVAVLGLALHSGSFWQDGDLVTMRSGGFYVASAIAVELAALVAPPRHRVRFALLAGAGVATFGLAGEWLWNAGAHQPWGSALLPDAALVGALAALGGAVLGTAFGAAIRGEVVALRPAVLAVAGAAVVAALAIPFPRPVGDVHAEVSVEVQAGFAQVEVVLDPPDAAADARWFQAISWQGGGLELAEMRQVAPGRYVADGLVPVAGNWKTLVRLHRGAELMTVPVFLPADPEIGAPEIPAVDRSMAFQPEQRYLMREFTPGPPAFSRAVFAYSGLLALIWVTAITVTAARITRSSPVAPDGAGRRTAAMMRE